MNRRQLLIAAPAALIGAAGLWYAKQPGSSGPNLAAAMAQDATAVDTSGVAEISMGNPDAKVTVIEYASYTCPHCRNFHQTVFSELKSNYIDTGKINFIYREVYFDRFGLWAAMVARCGGEMRYFGIADMIYETQEEWVAGGDPAQIAQNLRKIGKKAGLSDAELDACMNDGEQAKALVAAYQKNAEADNIESTPTFVINGKKYSNMNYADFAATLDEKLAE
ncbi:MAG: DsbA family protein [Paracoccaceae bacterium]